MVDCRWVLGVGVVIVVVVVGGGGVRLLLLIECEEMCARPAEESRTNLSSGGGC